MNKNNCLDVEYSGQPPEGYIEPKISLPFDAYVDELYVPPVIHPTLNKSKNEARLKMWMIPAQAQLHSQLPNLTNVWTYRQIKTSFDDLPELPEEPQVPVGPTIEVRRGERTRIQWLNHLVNKDGADAKHPVVAVDNLPEFVRVKGTTDVHTPENLPGFTMGEHNHSAGHLPPWTVVHLHGGRTAPDSDGWTENGNYPGQIQSDVYLNNQLGTLLWYHDHAMAVTRLNVYAGLAGLYVIRDSREDELNLPQGNNDHELLLLIQDRNLTCAGDHPGIAADQLLHKTGTAGKDDIVFDNGGGSQTVAQAPMEFFGPLTMVNGRIFPKAKVKAGVYRLRILNGSNARTYRLRFSDGDGNPVAVPMQMIGSDGGLLAAPVDLNDESQHAPAGTITLASAERVDVLVDFSDFKGRRIELRNTAKSPFDGTDSDPDNPLNPSNPLADFLTYPQVMCFDVGKKSRRHKLLDWSQSLLPSAAAWRFEDADAACSVGRLLALVEDKGLLQLNECIPMKDDAGNDMFWDEQNEPPLPKTQLALKQKGEDRHRIYCLLPGMFSDAVRYLAKDGDVEIWKIINLSEDTHPLHIHLVQFKLLARDGYSTPLRFPPETGGIEIHFDTTAPESPLDRADTGWKDTIRINPNQMGVVAVPFRDYADDETTPDKGKPIRMTGRYMYHCHILEHEDHEMMRPFVVLPAAIVEQMHHAGMEMHQMTGTPVTAKSPGWYMEPKLCCCKEDMPMPPHD